MRRHRHKMKKRHSKKLFRRTAHHGITGGGFRKHAMRGGVRL
jgi:hypothetical protein